MGYFTYYNGKKVQPIIRIKGLSNGVNESRIERRMLNIFPNPATTQTTITYPKQYKENQLQIYNMLGQLVYEEKLQKSTNQTTINTSKLQSGIYKIILDKSSITLKINNP